MGVTSAGEAAVAPFLAAAGFVRATAGALLGVVDFMGPPAGDAVLLFANLAAAGDADLALLGDAVAFVFLLTVDLVGVGGLLLRICLMTGDTEGRVVAYRVTCARGLMCQYRLLNR